MTTSDPELVSETPDLAELRKRCEEFFRMLKDDYCEDRINKHENAIYEAALTALYGEDIWDWVNERIV